MVKIYRKRRVNKRRMPLRRRSVKRRSSAGARVLSAANSKVIKSNNSPLGQSFKANLPYFENSITIDPGLSGMAWYNFSANGLYDPNITGTGHQPLGFDQMMLMYDHYTVIGAKITVTFMNIDSTYPMIVGIKTSDTSQASQNLSQIIENGNVVYTTVGPYKTDQSVVTLTKKIGLKKFFRKPIVDTDYSGDVGSNPTEQAFFSIFCAGSHDQFDGSGVRMNVRLDYISIFREPKLLVQS